MGRRPAIKFFPHGQLHVWDVMSQQDTSSPAVSENHHYGAQRARASSNTTTNSRGNNYPKVDGETLSIRSRSHEHDHHHHQQQEHHFPTTSTTSTSTGLHDNKENTVPAHPSLSNSLVFDGRPSKDAYRNAMIAVVDSKQFSIFHAPFLLGSSFNADLQRALRSVLVLPSSTITDAYLAFLGLMRRYYQIHLPDEIAFSGGAVGSGVGNVSDVE